MRAPQVKAPRIKTILKPGCVLCKGRKCIDDTTPTVMCRINPKIYSGRITRSVTKLLDCIKDFILIETYRCMPLLGDEQENVPNWDVHIVRYSVVFINNPTPRQSYASQF